LTPQQYENAVLERFRTMFPLPRFDVVPNVHLRGSRSNSARQIDLCVFERGQPKPGLIVEVKRHKRPIDLVRAGSSIALVRDVGPIPAVMVASSGFSRAAVNYLAAESIAHITVTIPEARGLNWVTVIEKIFALHNQFRELSGDLVEALRNGDAATFLDDIDIPYEEWLAVMNTALGLFPEATAEILYRIAREHHDVGARFTAIQLLDDTGCLTQVVTLELLRGERDPDTRELLQAIRATAR
jgi:hypothetical protein